jgi:hypothetical protein
MSSCKATTGFSADCSDIKMVGGADRTVWFGYLSELDTQFDLTQTGNITQIDFGSYGGLRRFDGRKFSNSFGSEIVKTGGGNICFKQTLTVKMLPSTFTEDKRYQELVSGDDLFAIVQDNNRNLFILGASNGLIIDAGSNNSGETGESDIRDSITFVGFEQIRRLRFALAAGYQQTIDYLVSMEI